MASGVNSSACLEAASITWEVMVTATIADEYVVLELFVAWRGRGLPVLPLDVSVGKGYKYFYSQENLQVRGKNYAEHT
jgi:hypothetical protein